ncbi:hypothetical protein Tco_1492779 [Tanacetum coccineum]
MINQKNNSNKTYVIIMAQQQHAAEVHLDELCPPNKRYDLMDANKKVDLEHRSSPPVPCGGGGLKLSLTLDDFRTIFHLPQANDNNHNSFMPPPSFSDMVPFYKHELGFTMELKTSSSFKTTGLLQPWQTLCKIFSKCLTTPTMGRTLLFSLSSNIFDSEDRKIKLACKFQIRKESLKEITQLLDKADGDDLIQDTLQISLAEHKSSEKAIARENVELVNKHLTSEEIEKMMKGSENVIDDSLPPRNDEPNILGTRLEPRMIRKVRREEITKNEEGKLLSDFIPVNVNEEEEEITDEVYELK